MEIITSAEDFISKIKVKYGSDIEISKMAKGLYVLGSIDITDTSRSRKLIMTDICEWSDNELIQLMVDPSPRTGLSKRFLFEFGFREVNEVPDCMFRLPVK